MRKLKVLLLFVGLWALQPTVLKACESYLQISLDEIKEYRTVLHQADADPLDRLFAFEQMVCSDRPNIRHYALKEGLSNISDPLVRNEIMLKAMMQKTRIDVELAIAKTLTKNDKAFITENGGVFSKAVAFKSETDGCISIHHADCRTDYSLWIRGDHVELGYGSVLGEFRLTDTNELVGTLRASNKKEYTNIPAIIKLF